MFACSFYWSQTRRNQVSGLVDTATTGTLQHTQSSRVLQNHTGRQAELLLLLTTVCLVLQSEGEGPG